MNTIDFFFRDNQYQIPNAWELLSQDQYIGIITDLSLMAAGQIPPIVVATNHVCRCMGWDIYKLSKDLLSESDLTYANLTWLAQQVSFIFSIQYPDHDAVLEGLSPKERQLCKKIPPERLTSLPIARYLSRLDYHFVLDLCFARQIIPTIKAGNATYAGYTIDTSFNVITCSLSALQYIEARSLIGQTDKLPLLCAILYHPGAYNTQSAHLLSRDFARLPDSLLQAVAFNFQAFNNYLFSHTHFSILTAGQPSEQSSISTGAIESLYNFSADGLGDLNTVEQMNIIQYLTIMRKKIIDAVRTMNDAKIDLPEIEKKTGLPITLISKIIHSKQ